VIHKGDTRYVEGKSQRYSITMMETEKPPEEEMTSTTLDDFLQKTMKYIFYAKLRYVPSTMKI
jgi:phosphodiesterase/alkaline phosphatase D-like protein